MDCQRGAKICVLSFSTFYSVKNITEKNNCVKIGDKVFEIPFGNYNLTQLCEYLSEHNDGNSLHLDPLYTTNRVRLETKEEIDFNLDRSANNIFGFKKKIYSADEVHISEDPPKLNHIQSISVHCLNALGAFFNGRQTSEIHCAHVLVPPTFRVISEPKNLIHYKIKDSLLTRLHFEIRDEAGKLVSADWGSDIRFTVIVTSQ